MMTESVNMELNGKHAYKENDTMAHNNKHSNGVNDIYGKGVKTEENGFHHNEHSKPDEIDDDSNIDKTMSVESNRKNAIQY